MRQFLLDLVPDPGAIVIVVLAVAVGLALFAMLTDRRHIAIDDEFEPRPPVDLEDEARRRPF